MGCRRVDGNNGFTSARRVSTAHKIQLAAGSAVLVSQQVFGIARAGQVDLQRRIDGNYIVILRDHGWVIHVVDWIALHRWVVVKEFESCFLAPWRKQILSYRR